jgi:hypothetical protein
MRNQSKIGGFRYSRVGQSSAQSRTTIGESGHFGGLGPTHGFRGSLDQSSDIGLGPGDATKDLAAPVSVSMLPARTSKCRSPSSQLRTKVESKLIAIAAAAIGGFSTAASLSCLPICSVWRRSVSGLFPVSIGNRCYSTSAATRYGISADSRACS